MKRSLRIFAPAGVIVLAILLGMVLGDRGRDSGLWKNFKNWLGGDEQVGAAPADPALLATLPVPDPTAGLPPSPLNELLRPGLTPQEQTSIVGQMLIDYWTSVHALPNGTWEETCAQLAGANARKLALIPKEHPALGKDSFSPSTHGPGIRLHVISSSGCAFQLIHDGPDGEPYTDDDLIRNFPPDLEF